MSGVAMLIAGAVNGPSLFVFGAADIYYAAQSSWLPPPWAGTQIALGGVSNIAAGAIVPAIFARCASETFGPDRATGVAAFTAISITVGAFFATHGILSLALYEHPEEEGTSGASAPEATRFVPVVTAGPTGGSLTWQW
jgi:hypothetical protein